MFTWQELLDQLQKLSTEQLRTEVTVYNLEGDLFVAGSHLECADAVLASLYCRAKEGLPVLYLRQSV